MKLKKYGCVAAALFLYSFTDIDCMRARPRPTGKHAGKLWQLSPRDRDEMISKLAVKNLKQNRIYSAIAFLKELNTDGGMLIVNDVNVLEEFLGRIPKFHIVRLSLFRCKKKHVTNELLERVHKSYPLLDLSKVRLPDGVEVPEHLMPTKDRERTSVDEDNEDSE
ncbi:MAG: hypothetical protein LBG04_03785 [Holosporaceae bacterium]|jgi:hypothetical protein|nr:hypothetical protein [Holosporaceae bacterium]